jgi:hypothetical protein
MPDKDASEGSRLCVRGRFIKDLKSLVEIFWDFFEDFYEILGLWDTYYNEVSDLQWREGCADMLWFAQSLVPGNAICKPSKLQL